MTAGSIEAPEATTLALVRHGESMANHEGRIGGHGPTPLTELGRRQAQRTAEAIAAALRPTAIISSDLPRARQTAEPIIAATGLEPSWDVRWRERSLGVLDDLLFTDIENRYPDEWKRMRGRDLALCPEGAETLDQVFGRVGEGLSALLDNHAGGRVVVVSHALAIFHTLAHIFGLGSPSRGLGVFALVGNCSISRFRRVGDMWFVDAINDASHLRDDSGIKRTPAWP
ncbi:histidine phosphatase family protein [Haliangium ochraceum]|uniref:Phosphoglycerate mutase n=1 Tax=Haliangium ochraceum (strain DSM 14365 / JCM 11303 / SMP-2) TaxID=502025 RepID=D0LW76_HALO1|nr:histidine phosphatase family protein [Haliangium ochraceum]ACY16008.1 Phosphoglycerate mutase [Haliangium ochraceum DSM 14365]